MVRWRHRLPQSSRSYDVLNQRQPYLGSGFEDFPPLIQDTTDIIRVSGAFYRHLQSPFDDDVSTWVYISLRHTACCLLWFMVSSVCALANSLQGWGRDTGTKQKSTFLFRRRNTRPFKPYERFLDISTKRIENLDFCAIKAINANSS